jgi:phosphoenolpyruvate---glycerone phosphotransferase subunit DhaL
MTGTINGEVVVAGLRRAAARAGELRDWLNELDAAMGDGDTGISVAKAAAGLVAYLDANEPGEDLGKYLAGAGMAINRVASSTLGTLISTAFMRAGKVAQGKATVDSTTLAQMLEAANQGIQERGKAKPGDKTLVDALDPATAAFAASIAHGQSLATAAGKMVEAARVGRDAAIPLRGRMGRAAWVGERTENHPDPGSVFIVQILEILAGVDPSEPGSTLGAPGL